MQPLVYQYKNTILKLADMPGFANPEKGVRFEAD